jgi:hypothetical protein
VALVDPLLGVGAGLGGRDLGRLEHRVLDVAAAPGIRLGQRAEVHVLRERGLSGVELHPPDPLALFHVRHVEEDVGADPPLERGVNVGGEVGREDHYAGEGLQLVQQDVHDRVRLPLVRRAHRGEAASGDRVGLVEEEDRVLALRRAEHVGHVLGGLAHPARLQLGVAHHEQALVQRVRQRFGADGLASTGRPREVEGQAEPGRVPLGQTPLMEDEVVLPDQSERVVEGAERRRRENHVVEGPAGLDGLDQLARGRAEEEVPYAIGHNRRAAGPRGSLLTY